MASYSALLDVIGKRIAFEAIRVFEQHGYFLQTSLLTAATCTGKC